MMTEELQLFDELIDVCLEGNMLEPLLALGDPTPREDAASETTATDAQPPAPPTTKPRVKRSRNFSRERMRAELDELRVQSAALEQRLKELSSEHPASRDDELLLASWRRVALRQRNLRVRAEMENLRLRQQLETHATFSRELEEATLKIVSAGGGSLDSSSGSESSSRASVSVSFPPSHQPVPLESLGAQRVSVFEALVTELDAAYAKKESVFQENGLRKWQAAAAAELGSCASRVQAQMKSRRSVAPPEGSRYVELVNASVQSFPKDVVFQASFKCWDQFYSTPSRFVHVGLDPTGDRIAVKVEFEVTVDSKAIVIELLGVLKSFTDSDGDSTVVWRFVSMESPHFPGVYMSETGWEEFAAVGSTDTFQIMCSQLETRKLGDAAAPGSVPIALASAVATSYEADLEQASVLMSGLLLEEASGRTVTA